MRESVTVGITEKHLQEIYSDKYIKRVGHDHRVATPIIHPSVIYLSAWVGKDFAGAFLAIYITPIEIELHSLLKKEFVFFSRKLVNPLLNWAFSQPILRVTTQIIEGFEAAKNFCFKVGFSLEGIKQDACLKDGVAKKVYILGMTRKDWQK